MQALIDDWDEWFQDPANTDAQDEDDELWRKEDAKKTTFSETVTEIKTPKVVVTFLKEKAKRGDKKIQVESISGFRIGDVIIIGSSVFERKVITAFGSLEFDTPLEVSHEAVSYTHLTLPTILLV